MTKEEFIEKLELIVKYGGNIREFVEDNYNKLEDVACTIKFSLNDSFTGTFTETGAREWNMYMTETYNGIPPKERLVKAGDSGRVQFAELSKFTMRCFEQSPLVKCEFNKNNE